MKGSDRAAFEAFAEQRRAARTETAKAGPGTPALSKRLADFMAEMAPGAAAQEAAQPFLRAAAVLAAFQPARLRARPEGPAAPAEVQETLIGAADALLSPRAHWALCLDRRREVLRQMETRAAMAAALAANAPGPDLPAQHGFAAILAGPGAVEAALAGEDIALLTGILEALGWVGGLEAPGGVGDILPDLPDRDRVMSAIARARMTKPLADLVGRHFTGRADVLARMRDHIAGPPSDSGTLFLHGPGGSGKSTVLAKFALDLRASGVADLTVYLNFDRPVLRVEEPLTALREAVVQLAEQAPSRRDHLIALAAAIDGYIRRFEDGREASEIAFDGGGGWEEMVATVAAELGRLPGEGPVLVLVDTFEQAQQHGHSLVREFWRLLDRLGRLAPRLRFIAAGRVDAFGLFPNALALEGLGRAEVASMLAGICEEPLPAGVVDEVLRVTRGRPLSVRLAALLFRRIGPARLAQPQVLAEALVEVTAEHAGAVLYNRLLGQITDAGVRKVARPGLLLRQVTPGLIAKVLAPACGLDLPGGDAGDLFRRYAEAVDLVAPGTAEWGEPMLTHRADLRAEMLGELRDGDPDLIARVDREAIAFFAAQAGPMARAEEIYHLLWTEAPAETIGARWQPGVAPFLIGAAEEVPPARRAWLANRLGIDIPDEVRGAAAAAEWEGHALRGARSLLNRGDAAGALSVLRERTGRLPGSALFLAEADALHRLDRAEERDATIRAGLRSAAQAGPGARRQAAELWLLRAQVLEGRRRFAAAGADTVRALAAARDFGDDGMELRALAGLLRLHRKSDRVPGPDPGVLAREAGAILDRIGEGTLQDRPALMRALAGELGPLRPGFVQMAVTGTGRTTLARSGPVVRAILLGALRAVGDMYSATLGDVVARLTVEVGGPDIHVPVLRDVLGELSGVAAERGLAAGIAAPVAGVLAAEADEAVGAHPAPSRAGRRPGWWP